MKKAQVALVVNLVGNLRRVLAHWFAVDAVLPAECPLLLLAGVSRTGFGTLLERLSKLRDAEVDAEVKLKVAWADYKERKRELHRCLLLMASWMRGSYQGTACFALLRRVPGLGQSYQHWWDAGLNALAMWELAIMESAGPPKRPIILGDGRTVEQFAELLNRFEAAYWAITVAEVELKIARSQLGMAQAEATALLMAYGHGVRARLGQKGALVRSIPQLWPKHPRKKKAA